MIRDYLIGSDIELFVRDNSKNMIVSAEGYAKGTKKRPFVFDPSNKFFATSLDNVLFEFCIPPAKTADEFLANIKKSMAFVNSELPDYMCTVAQASAHIDNQFLQTRNAKVFGCEPDYNAWTRGPNEPPKPNSNLRSAGFHVHVGFEDRSMDNVENLVRAMDLFLGIPSLLIDPDKLRRRLYGKAGSFRTKPYGCEYRVLSGFFSGDDKLIQWVYKNTEKAIQFVNSGETVDPVVEDVINSSNEPYAKHIVNQFNIQLP